MAAAVIASLALGNTVELSTGDLRKGSAFDNLKATFSQALKLGNQNANLDASYDHNAHKDFLNEVSVSGNLIEASKDSDVALSYEATHNFADKSNNMRLTASTKVSDTKVGAEIDGGNVEVSAERDMNLGDQTVNVQPSWLVQAQTARVKLMSKLNCGDRVSAQVDYGTKDGGVTTEVSYDHQLEDGRDISATVKPGSKELEVDYVDNKFENGATWTASASVPLENSGSSNILDAAKLTLKRSWAW
jgi:hypothetical protein